jgi:hypothetical protein
MDNNQIKEQRERIKKFYEEQIPFLKLQLEFERMATEIEMLRRDKYIAMQKYAELTGTEEKSNQQDGNSKSGN